MFARFNYLPKNYYYNHYFNPHLESGRKIYDATIEQTRKCLREFILENGHIDGTALKDHWFNIIDADIFLSHSHNDIEKVKGFAGWLYDQFGLTSFIDSCVWGYCDDLLKEIDAQYLIEYLQDLNNTILSWKDRLNITHVEYEELLEFDCDDEYAIDSKKEEFNALSKEYY